MAELLTLILVGLSVGLGNFAASVAIGLSGLNRSLRLKIALVFGIFETVMPLVGLALGSRVAGSLGQRANLLGGGLLVATGLHLTISALKQRDNKEVAKAAGGTFSKLLLTAIALSIDNLIVGFSLGTHQQSLITAAAVIGISSVALSMVGLEVGSRLSSKVEEYSEILSGLILVGVGVAVGFKWL